MTKDINNTHTAHVANAPHTQPDEWVRRAMERFLDGTTTVDEERRLAAYFAQAKGLEGEWLMYRDMFAYMGEGMPMGQLPEFDGTDEASPSAPHMAHVATVAPVAKVSATRRRLVWMGGLAAAAAVAALLVVVGIGHGPQADMGQGMVATLPAIDERPVAADTVAAPAKGASDVGPDQGEATDAAPASRRKHPTKVRRHRYDIVAPKTYYAKAEATGEASAPKAADAPTKADTPSVADLGCLMAEQQRQIDDEYLRVEREIQETLTLIDQVREQLMANDSDTEEIY